MATKNKSHKGKTIAVSGGFDPFHVGHLDMLEAAKNIVGPTGTLIVFVNSDDFLLAKKGKAFMALPDRMRLIRALSVVDEVVAVVDTDMTVQETIRQYHPDIFANGGDRTPMSSDSSEMKMCNELGIIMLYSIGGAKTRSSSELLTAYNKN